jgi:hypothetical protein
VGKLEGKRPLGKPRRRWADNIDMGLGYIRWSVVDWNGGLRIGTSGELL